MLLSSSKRQTPRPSRTQLAALLAGAQDVLVLLDGAGVIDHSTGGLERVLGYEGDELTGRNVFELVHPDDLARARSAFERGTGIAGATESVELRCRHADGSWRTLAVVGTNRLEEKGVERVVLSARDLTEQVVSDELLRDREARLRILVDRFPIVVWTVDRDLELTSLMGPGLAEPARWEEARAWDSAHEILGGETVDPGAREAYTRALVGERADFSFSVAGRRFQAHVAPLLEEERVVGAMGIALDVTELARTQAELTARQLQLEKAQKLEAIGRLAAGIAHDFTNILTSVLGNSRLLVGDLPRRHPSRRQAEAIERAAGRGAEMVAQLLAFSRRQVLLPRPLDLNELVRGLDEIVRRALPDGVEYATDLDEGLHLLHADAGQVERVLVNLVTNACQAMPRGGRLTISTRNLPVTEAAALGVGRGPTIAFAVADTGTGIAAETLSEIFDPFFTTKAAGGGTGLGLPTVRSIVEQSGGEIRAESEVGRGTRFTVYLPCAPVEARAAAGAPGSEGGVPSGPATVLVADDDDDVRDFVARTLLERGYTVRAARDGAEALAIVERERLAIDMLVTDVSMPGLGGVAVASRVLQLRPGLPVLFMSATGAPVAVGPDAAEGVAGLLPKPFTAHDLVREVGRALGAATASPQDAV